MQKGRNLPRLFMLSIEQLKKINPHLANLSDNEILEIRNSFDLDQPSGGGTINLEGAGDFPDANVITVPEYRKILDDYTSSDDQIKQRLQYLEAFCRNIIRDDLEKYVAQNRKKI
jgi:hypothetical protein